MKKIALIFLLSKSCLYYPTKCNSFWEGKTKKPEDNGAVSSKCDELEIIRHCWKKNLSEIIKVLDEEHRVV